MKPFLSFPQISAYNKFQQMQFVPKELNPVVKQREKGEKALLALMQEEKMEE